jgi:hypothetical protein
MILMEAGALTTTQANDLPCGRSRAQRLSLRAAILSIVEFSLAAWAVILAVVFAFFKLRSSGTLIQEHSLLCPRAGLLGEFR